MKVVILAGGLGTRMAEETALRPKPMVEIGGKPILDHIMRWYSKFGFKEFVIALGYKGESIKQYFLNYYELNSDMSISLKDGSITVHERERDDWVVHLVDTGISTNTAGRIARLKNYLAKDAHFMLTYGDGVANVDLVALLDFHKAHGRAVTLTAVHPPSRFGGLDMRADGAIMEFTEKPDLGEGLINGGYFVVNNSVLDMLEVNSPMWERYPLPQLAQQNQLMAYHHTGFWQAMDNVRERQMLEDLWATGNAPWKVNA